MKKTACESCANYVYDPESDIMYCDMELDEDENAALFNLTDL